MEKIKQLVSTIIKIKSDLGYEMNSILSSSLINKLEQEVFNRYSKRLPNTYLFILSLTNGINFNGLFFYGNSENPAMDFMASNDAWHKNSNFAQYIFYADSEMYLFTQSLNDNLFSYRYRDDFDTIIYSTTDDKEFFEIILKCALGEDVESIYTFR